MAQNRALREQLDGQEEDLAQAKEELSKLKDETDREKVFEDAQERVNGGEKVAVWGSEQPKKMEEESRMIVEQAIREGSYALDAAERIRKALEEQNGGKWVVVVGVAKKFAFGY